MTRKSLFSKLSTLPVLLWGIALSCAGAGAQSVSITSPVEGAEYTIPTDVVVTCAINAGGKTISRVRLYVGTSNPYNITNTSTPPYTTTWQNPPPNAGRQRYTLTVRVEFKDNSSLTSGAVHVTVVPNNNPPPADNPGVTARSWWVYMSPDEAAAFYNSPTFVAVKAHADTYYLNGYPLAKTCLDHSSEWSNEMANAQETLSATYLGLHWGRYRGASAPETDTYLNRIVSNWYEIMTAGPVDCYWSGVPRYEGSSIGHGSGAQPFTPGWYEGDITLRRWIPGGIPSYDAIRDDIASLDRDRIDTWMKTLAVKYWADGYQSYQNRGASARSQALIFALLLQDADLFNRYFNDTQKVGGEPKGFYNALSWFNYPSVPSADPDGIFARPGLSFQLSDHGDGPHGVAINAQIFSALAILTHAARNGGEPSWDAPAVYADQQNLTDQLNLWYEIAGPLLGPFINDDGSYLKRLQPTLVGSQEMLNKTLWFGYAAIDPVRFLSIGDTYGSTLWTWPGKFADSVTSIHDGNEALWKFRVRALNGLDTSVAPPDELWNATNRIQTSLFMTPQTKSFTATVLAKPASTDANCLFWLSKIGLSGSGPLLRFGAAGKIEALNGGTYTGSLPYSAGVSYTLRLAVDVPNHLYSAYVTPDGGSESTLGENLAFPSAYSGVDLLNQWSYKNNNTFIEVRNFRIILP